MVRDVCLAEYEEVLQRIRVNYTLWRGRMVIELPTGSIIYFRSADKPKRLYGLTLDWVHLDEAATMPAEVYHIAVDRVSAPPVLERGQIFLTTTPQGRNWVYDLAQQKDVKLIKVKTIENPFVSTAEIRRAKALLPDKYFRQQYLADFVTWEGLVYDEYQPDVHLARQAPARLDEVVLGIDPGYTNPAAIVVVGRCGDKIYVLEDYEQSGLLERELVEVIKDFAARWSARAVYVDPEDAGLRAALRAAGLPTRQADNDVFRGIQTVKGLLRAAVTSRKRAGLYILAGAQNVLRELSLYAWDDRKPNTPCKQDDHAMDAMRYAIMGLVGTTIIDFRPIGVGRRAVTI